MKPASLTRLVHHHRPLLRPCRLKFTFTFTIQTSFTLFPRLYRCEHPPLHGGPQNSVGTIKRPPSYYKKTCTESLRKRVKRRLRRMLMTSRREEEKKERKEGKVTSREAMPGSRPGALSRNHPSRLGFVCSSSVPRPPRKESGAHLTTESSLARSARDRK